MIISGILGFIKSIYYAVADVGTALEILFRYVGRFFDFIGYILNIFSGRITFLPDSLGTILVSLVILLLLFKVVGRE